MDNLTAATVTCNTKELLERSVGSVSQFYPDLKIMIIDGSTKALKYNLPKNTELYAMGYNIGHGPGMNLAINMCQTPYILLFDTDIVMEGPCIEKMMELFEEDTFGVGDIYPVSQSTYFIQFGDGSEDIPVLHPYFHIVQKKIYEKYFPYVQNGGPTFLTALDIFSRGLSDKILKKFPVLDYVEHRWRGTRDVRPPDMFKDSVSLSNPLAEQFVKMWNEKN
jgi:GT2 family glycosyltransferase